MGGVWREVGEGINSEDAFHLESLGSDLEDLNRSLSDWLQILWWEMGHKIELQDQTKALYEHFNNIWSPFGPYQKVALRTEIKIQKQLWSCKVGSFRKGLEKLKTFVFNAKPIGQAPPGNFGPVPGLMVLSLGPCGKQKRKNKLSRIRKYREVFKCQKNLDYWNEKHLLNRNLILPVDQGDLGA